MVFYYLSFSDSNLYIPFFSGAILLFLNLFHALFNIWWFLSGFLCSAFSFFPSLMALSTKFSVFVPCEDVLIKLSTSEISF